MFFHILSYLMFGTVMYASQLRASVVQHVCNHWQRFKMNTLMPCGNIYTSIAEYRDHIMSLRTTYASPCEIQATAEIYLYHLMDYYNGAVIIQPDEYIKNRPLWPYD